MKSRPKFNRKLFLENIRWSFGGKTKKQVEKRTTPDTPPKKHYDTLGAVLHENNVDRSRSARILSETPLGSNLSFDEMTFDAQLLEGL